MNHIERALQENWLGYVWEHLGIDGCRRSGALRGTRVAPVEEWSKWARLDLMSPGTSTFVQQLRKTRLERSLKAIARLTLKKELQGYRDYATTGLKLLRGASSHDDMALGYTLIGLALDKFPTTTPCQFWFCFRNVPSHGRQRKYCDAHTPGSTDYMRARFFEGRLKGANGQNPNRSSWFVREIEEEAIICGSKLSSEEKQEALEMAEEIEQMNRGMGIADDPLPMKLSSAKWQVVSEIERAQYENLGLIEPPPQTDWRAVVLEWCRKYPWLPQATLTTQSWPSVVDILHRVLKDKHCDSRSVAIWGAKLENSHWERELIHSYDYRRRPSLLSDQIVRLGRMGLRQSVIASQLGISRDTVSQCIKRETDRTPMRYPELRNLRRAIVRKSGVNTESN
jgi:hypothetical protein